LLKKTKTPSVWRKSGNRPKSSLKNQILTLTQSKDYGTNQAKQEHVKRLEHEIDKLVYKLYGLTEEEIKIIEGG